MKLDRMEERLEEIRHLASDLQRQGERCALVGLLQQATAILDQVWTITQEHQVEYADAAAWEAFLARASDRLDLERRQSHLERFGLPDPL